MTPLLQRVEQQDQDIGYLRAIVMLLEGANEAREKGHRSTADVMNACAKYLESKGQQ